MSWVTLITALIYTSALAYLVLVKGWSLLHAGLVIVGIGLSVTLSLVLIVMRMPEEDKWTVWQAFQRTWRKELRGVMNLLLFRGKG